MLPRSIAVTRIIEDQPIGRFQIGVIAICAIILFFDGFDAQVIGFIAPNLISEWSLPPGSLGPVFSAGLVGLMLGALFIAPLADRFGRRLIILVSVFLFGVFSLVTIWAQSTQDLLILRLLTGLGLGGCMPNAIALTSEYSPQRKRAFLITLMFSGFSVGSLCGGLLAAQAVPVYGWKSVFLVGGALPLLSLPALYFMLPESLRYLAGRGGEEKRAAHLLNRLAPSLRATEHDPIEVEASSAARMSVKALFGDGRGLRTVLLWLVFFMSLLDVYMMVNWLPTLMSAVGAPLRTAVLLGVLLQCGGIVGSLILGLAIDRRGSASALVFAYIIGALSIAGLGAAAGLSGALTMIAVFGAGIGVIGGQTGANAVAADVYPTEIRSTGVGWALGVGRLGSIVGPVVGGILVSMQVPVRDIFFLSAIPAGIASLAMIILGASSRRRGAGEAR